MFKVLTPAALLIAAVWFVVAPSPAIAHTDIVGSAPADGARLASTPTQVTLEFNETVSTRLAAVTVQVGAENLGELPVEQGKTASQLIASLAGGLTEDSPTATDRSTWTVSYRVTSSDGHPIEGQIQFVAPLPPANSATDAPSSPSSPSSSPSDSGADAPVGDGPAGDSDDPAAATVVIGALAAAGAAVGCVLLVRARRRPNES